MTAAPPPRSPVLLGVDRLLGSPESFPALFSSVSRVGLVTSDGTPPGPYTFLSTRKALLDAGAPLARLFAPEHGLSAMAGDGEAQPDGLDAETGLPVVSLYGVRFSPPPDTLAELDLVLFDLQDVGTRFYTFLWTLSHLMEACGEAGVPLWVLDRPNPLGGEPGWVEGPLPDRSTLPSFLCRWPVPLRHSLTLGEMALLLREEMAVGVELSVVGMEGWRRAMLWPDTGLPFHPPSPGIPTFASALLYPGTALLEATNVSEGRGTAHAFCWVGAPWMDGGKLSDAINGEAPPGILATPMEQEAEAGVGSVPGVLLDVLQPTEVRPVALGLRLISLLRTLWPMEFRWAPYPTAANPTGEHHLERLLGRADLAAALEGPRGPFPTPWRRDWTDAPGWWERATPHLLYD